MASGENRSPPWLGCMGILAVLFALALLVYLFLG
jgi:hypothetical protein